MAQGRAVATPFRLAPYGAGVAKPYPGPAPGASVAVSTGYAAGGILPTGSRVAATAIRGVLLAPNGTVSPSSQVAACHEERRATAIAKEDVVPSPDADAKEA